MQRKINELPMTRVICPDCGSGGGSTYPCWCHVCNYRVLMLPATNDRIKSNWGEHFSKLPLELVRKFPHAGVSTP